MSAQVWTALIAGLGGLATSAVALTKQQRMADAQRSHDKAMQEERYRLDAQRRADEASAALEDRLRLVREPLKSAVEDLLHRVKNIRERHFFDYLDDSTDPSLRRMAKLGTLYRFTVYWSLVQQLYGSTAISDLEQHPALDGLPGLLVKVDSTMATDKGFGPAQMVWRDEQRAIGQLAVDASGDRGGVIGVAQFVAQYDEVFEPWFGRFWRDLEQEPASPRMAELGQRLESVLALLRQPPPTPMPD